eukprot:TRINITY_DN52656_c0_g1_i1.p1 TRINITY_DN52656_c0_g1~~TRINITY_DN52656_c0_g1_i1.p1  ORF type:complete len:678 (-),score=40.73 TRINITY_DN52656_c0_g1_i1:3036-5021(-)
MSGILVYANLAQYTYPLHFATCFFIAFLWLFTLEYLEIKKHFKRLSRFFLFVSSLFFALGLYTFFDYHALVVNGSAFVAIITMLMISIYLYIKKIIRAKYFSYVIVIYLVSGFIYLAMLSGFLEYNYFTRNSVLFATGLSNILFMLILTRRYKKLKDEYKQELEKTVSQRTKELQKANKDKELLLKEIQHRVKNNFHLILALLWMKSKTNTEIAPIIRRIESMALIHDYLYNSNNLDEFDMEKYLREITNSFIINDRVEIHISYNLDFNIQNNNAINLAMIVNEIITNSIKHNQTDSIKIDIEVKNDGKRVFFIIQDNGSGVVADWQNGLGLEMVDDFCSKLKESSCTITNNNGVRFELHYMEEQMLEGLNILIVEDEFVASKYLAEILKEIDFMKIDTIHNAKNAKGAFDIVERNKIELIFMDINLGDGEDGITCAKKICEKQNTQIIFTTAYSDTETILDASKTNIVGYLCKPFNLPSVKGVLSIAVKTIEERKPKSDGEKVSLSGYTYDTKENTIYKDGEIVKLSAKEKECLSMLYSHKNNFVSSEHLCAYVWCNDGYDPKNSLRELLHRLRKKLPDLEIENIPNLGYSLKAQQSQTYKSWSYKFGLKQTTPRGGRFRFRLKSYPLVGCSSLQKPPPFPRLLPPKASLSLFSTSSQKQ